MKHPTEVKELTVIARSPFQIYYEGPAKSVSGKNMVGPFDVLPGHADFFSVMEAGEVLIETGAQDPIAFTITTGIITVRDNQVMLFANM